MRIYCYRCGCDRPEYNVNGVSRCGHCGTTAELGVDEVRQMMSDVAREHARTWHPSPGFRP